MSRKKIINVYGNDLDAIKKLNEKLSNGEIAIIGDENGNIIVTRNLSESGEEYDEFPNKNFISSGYTGKEEFADTISALNERIDHVEETEEKKQDLLVSGENIKTINNISVLGKGNISISGGSGSVDMYSMVMEEKERSKEYTLTRNDESVGDKIVVESLNGYATQEWVNEKNYADKDYVAGAISGKQDIIEDIDAIRAGSSKGLTSVQFSDLETVAFSGEYNDLKDKPTIPSLDGYATEGYVDNAISAKTDLSTVETIVSSAIETETARTESTYLKEHQSLDGYATEQWVENKGYLTEHQSLEGYAKVEDMPTKTSELTNDSGFLTEHQSLENYYTSAQTDSKISDSVSGKQDTLIAGENITIENNVISANAGSGSNVSWEQIETGGTQIATITINGESTIVKAPIAGGDLSNYYTKSESNQNLSEAIKNETARTETTYLKEHQSLNGYATETWVENKGYLTEHQSLDGYAKTEDIPTKTSELTNDSGFITEHQSLDDYYTSGETDSKIAAEISKEEEIIEANYAKKSEIPSLSGYATESWVEGKGYLTEHQSLENYYTSAQTISAIENSVSGKQDTIEDLEDIRNGATLGSTAVQPEILSQYVHESEIKPVAKTGSYNDLTDKPTIPSLEGYATENYVDNSVSGKVSQTVFQTLSNKIIPAGDEFTPIYSTLNGLVACGFSIKVLTISEYNALEIKNPTTIYLCKPDEN